MMVPRSTATRLAAVAAICGALAALALLVAALGRDDAPVPALAGRANTSLRVLPAAKTTALQVPTSTPTPAPVRAAAGSSVVSAPSTGSSSGGGVPAPSGGTSSSGGSKQPSRSSGGSSSEDIVISEAVK